MVILSRSIFNLLNHIVFFKYFNMYIFMRIFHFINFYFKYNHIYIVYECTKPSFLKNYQMPFFKNYFYSVLLFLFSLLCHLSSSPENSFLSLSFPHPFSTLFKRSSDSHHTSEKPTNQPTNHKAASCLHSLNSVVSCQGPFFLLEPSQVSPPPNVNFTMHSYC